MYIIDIVRNISQAARQHVTATAAQASLILGESDYLFKAKTVEKLGRITRADRESVCRAAARLMTNVPSGIDRKYILQAVEATSQDKREGVISFVE